MNPAIIKEIKEIGELTPALYSAKKGERFVIIDEENPTISIREVQGRIREIQRLMYRSRSMGVRIYPALVFEKVRP